MSTDSRIGSRFARYRIESVLGRGGMGVVYLAEDAQLGRKVALKLLPLELAQDQTFRQRFIRESQMAAGLEHPNILPVYEAGEAEGQLFIAMRYVRGADLGSVLETEGPVAVERAVSIVADVAAALDEAHGEGLIHRDVKPANILLAPARGPGSPERAYLTDFGVTRRTTSRSGLTQTGQFMGTVDYAAPEQIEGKEVDRRADVYSLGCVLYHCLTGEPPFVRDSDVATMYAHLRDRPPKPSAKRPELPTALDEVVIRATAKAPSDRYGTAGELASAARGATSGHAVRGKRVRVPSRRALVAIGAAVLAALAVVAVAITQAGDGKVRVGPSPSPSGLPRVTGVLRIDPESGRTLSAAALRPVFGVTNLAVGDEFLWVLEFGGLHKVTVTGTVLGDLIDVGRTRGCVAFGPICPASLAAGEGSAWVVFTSVGQVGQPSTLTKIDPRTNGVEGFTVPGVAPGGAFSGVPIAAGAGWVWTIDRSPPSLLRLDPENPNDIDRFTLRAPGDGIGIGFGSVWVRHNSGIESFLTRVNPRTGSLIKTISLPGSADGLAFGGGNVWVSDSTGDELIRIDPATNTIADHFEVGRDPQAVAVDDAGRPWVILTGEGTGGEAGTLVKVDPTTGSVLHRVPLGGTVGLGIPTRRSYVLSAFGSIWVA
jgi:hypothetical protein